MNTIRISKTVYWCVKTPKGTLITSSANQDKTACYEDYVNTAIDNGFIPLMSVWYGEDYYEKMWRLLEDYDFRLVECIMSQNEYGAYQWPEPIELPYAPELQLDS